MATFEDHFHAAEEEAFRFLVTEHGFHRKTRSVERVSAESGVVGRVVYGHDGAQAELGRTVTLRIAPLQLELELAIAGPASAPFGIEELHAVGGRGPFPVREHGLYDAMDRPDELLAEFHRLAGVLRASGSRFFSDDSSLWEDLEARRERKAEDEETRRTLVLSREAFHERDWARVVDLLRPIERRLGTRASARLAYADRKARGAA